MKISEKFKVREMAGEHVIIMPGRCGADMTRILALNDSSLYLWEALGGKDFTTGDAAALLLERYDVDEATAQRDAGAWAAKLAECGVRNRRHVSGARAENLKGSMKLKRLISLLLLAIYLTAWGGPAYVSLSCKCVTMSSHVCCHHCQHSADAAGAGESLKAPCCGNHHSTEIELYTGSSSDNHERFIRCTVTDLPPALVAEAPVAAVLKFFGETLPECGDPFVMRGHVRSAGLRAPPVLA